LCIVLKRGLVIVRVKWSRFAGLMFVSEVADFKCSVEAVSAKFVKADKRMRALANLKRSKGRLRNVEVWLPCVFLGVPCFSRAVVSVESETKSCKSSVQVCSEVKYCLLSTRPK